MALFVVALLTLGLSSAAIAADQAYLYTGTFSSEGSGDGEMTHPRRSAVEVSTGNVLVADRDNSRVQVFSPTSEAAEYLTQFGAGTLDKPFGLAVDQSTGAVYVSDPGKGEVFKFSSNGAPTPVYSLDATFTSPAQGSGAGQLGSFEADLAVDPASGDLLVLDVANDRVSRFEADGTFVSSFTGADSPDGAFTGLLDLDVAPNGDVYVVDSTGPVYVIEGEIGSGGLCEFSAYCDGAPSRVLRFDSAGVYQSTVRALQGEAAGLVTVDPGNDQVLVGRANPQNIKVWVYAPSDARLIQTLDPPNVFTGFPGMAAGAGRLYVVNDIDPRLFGSAVAVKAFSALDLPEVTIDPAGVPSDSAVSLSGSVNPHGSPVNWYFQYRAFGGNWAEGPKGSLPGGASSVPVSGELTGLQPSLEYEARLVAQGPAGPEVASAPVAFTTASVPPLALTRFVAPRTDTTARLNGYVTPRNEPTTYYYEWGPTAAYGQRVPAASTGSAGSGNVQRLVAETLTGLQPSTTYHYRLVAENGSGKAEGEDRVFSTRSAAEMQAPSRGIELVNPPDKGNQNVSGYLHNDGGKVVWTTMTGVAGAPQGLQALFLAERAPAGWASRSMLPDTGSLIGGGEYTYSHVGSSRDYSKLIYRVGEDANRDSGGGDPFYFTRFDLASGHQETLDYLPEGGFATPNADSIFLVSDDAQHVYMFIRDVPNGSAPYQAYDIGQGERRLISVLPETGQPPACGVRGENQDEYMSSDGSRLYFLTSGDSCSDPLHLYLYDSQGTDAAGDDTVTRVDSPAVSGPEASAYAIRKSADGSSIVYFTKAQITADDSNSEEDVYRWSIGNGNECITCIVPNPALQTPGENLVDNLYVSKDLSRLYLDSTPGFVAGLGSGDSNSIYEISNEQIRYVAPGGSSPIRVWSDATRDGGILMFISSAAGITVDDNEGTLQAYRYVSADGSVECLSCSPKGVPSREVAFPPVDAFLELTHPERAARASGMTADGSTYVFLTEAALLPDDVNNGPDIYEWRNGTLSLVSDGEGKYGGDQALPLDLEGISPDGTDVLFRVAAQLTGFERDQVGQLFVARVGGGFPRPNPAAPCSEDACQGPLAGVPGFAQPGSAALAGAGNAREEGARKPRARAKCKGKFRTARGGKARAQASAKKKAARCGKPRRAGNKGKRAQHAARSGK